MAPIIAGKRVQALLLSLLLLLSANVVVLEAFPTGPGNCPEGTAANTGHPVLNPIPTFAQQGYALLIDGVAVTNPSSITLQMGKTYLMAVRSTGSPFKGALIRVGGKGTMTAVENSGIAAVCGAVPAVGHTSNAAKTILSGSYTVADSGTLNVDVTVVQDFATYSYQRFQFSVGAAPTAPPPTARPVPAPTGRPVPAPTGRPVPVPTGRPVPAPTGRPVAVPVTAPVVAPVTAPVVAPVTAPVVAPVTAPVVAPVPAPVVAPVAAPVIAPVAAPVVAPVAAPVIAPVTAPVVAPVTAPVVAPAVPVAVPTDPPVDKCVRRRKA